MSQNPSTVFTISQIHHHSHCIHRILSWLLQLHRFFTLISYMNSSQNYYNFTGSLHTLIICIQLLWLHKFFHNHYNFADAFHILLICCTILLRYNDYLSTDLSILETRCQVWIYSANFVKHDWSCSKKSINQPIAVLKQLFPLWIHKIHYKTQ
jgi:hypothetical protein